MPDLTAVKSLQRPQLGRKQQPSPNSNKTDFDKPKCGSSQVVKHNKKCEPSLGIKFTQPEISKSSQSHDFTPPKHDLMRVSPQSVWLEKPQNSSQDRRPEFVESSRQISSRMQNLEASPKKLARSAEIKPQISETAFRPLSPAHQLPSYLETVGKIPTHKELLVLEKEQIYCKESQKIPKICALTQPVEMVSVPAGEASGKSETANSRGLSGSTSFQPIESSRRASGSGTSFIDVKFSSAQSSSGLNLGESQTGSRILIKGGGVVNEDSIVLADVYIEDGTIKEVAPSLQAPSGARIIDATGKYVMPGGIDPHTHFKTPFFGTQSVDDFETGTKAAVAGGTTMIIDFVMAYKNDSLLSTYEKYRSWADPDVLCDYGLSIIVSRMDDKIKNEMTELVKNKGINSFKFCLAYHGILQVSDKEFYDGLVHCRKLGALARVHAENGDLIDVKQKELLALGITGPEGHLQSRPEEAAEEATYRACLLAREANCPLYVVHVMSQGSSNAIQKARWRGAVVFGEAIGSALASIDGANVYDRCWHHAAAHVMSPPLSADLKTGGRLLDALAAGQLQTTGSDHAVFDSKQKALGKQDFTKIPNGVNGVEERMMVVWQNGVNSGKMDPMRFVAITSSTAAKLFNIYPKKGRIAPHCDADIVVWDPDARHTISARTHFSKVDINIFEGIECVGCPEITICGGKVVYENGKIYEAARGSGKFVTLPPFAPLAFATISRREKCRQPIKIDRTSTPAAAGGTSGNGVPMALKTPSSTTPSGVTSPMSPFTNDVDVLTNAMSAGGKFSTGLHVTSPSAAAATADFHSRPITRSGGRNLQDSSFTLSGAQIDDDQASRRSTKISKPPGGESRGLW